MTITGLSGDIGSGKSWKMLQYALEQANQKQKYLVTNFGLNYKNLKKYCAARGQSWNVYCIDRHLLTVVAFEVQQDNNRENHSLIPLFKDRENCIICLDEAGIFLNARAYRNTPAQLLMDLAQSRKSGNDLIWASQFDAQVDIQFRNLTQYWIHCEGYTNYDKVMRRPALKWKTYYYFKGAQYERWQRSSKARTSFLRTIFAYTFKCDVGPLSKKDIMLFSAFDSFTRLENQAQAAIEAKPLKPGSLVTAEQLQNYKYFSRTNYDRCLVHVANGRLQHRPKNQKSLLKPKTPWHPKPFDWLTETADLMLEPKQETNIVKCEVLPPAIIYKAPEQAKSKALPISTKPFDWLTETADLMLEPKQETNIVKCEVLPPAIIYKAPEQAKSKALPISTKPFDWLTETADLMLEPKQETNIVKCEVLPPAIIYKAPEQAKSKALPISTKPLLVPFAAACVALFFFAYNFVDARIASPRRAPRAGGAGQTAQDY